MLGKRAQQQRCERVCARVSVDGAAGSPAWPVPLISSVYLLLVWNT